MDSRNLNTLIKKPVKLTIGVEGKTTAIEIRPLPLAEIFPFIDRLLELLNGLRPEAVSGLVVAAMSDDADTDIEGLKGVVQTALSEIVELVATSSSVDAETINEYATLYQLFRLILATVEANQLQEIVTDFFGAMQEFNQTFASASGSLKPSNVPNPQDYSTDESTPLTTNGTSSMDSETPRPSGVL